MVRVKICGNTDVEQVRMVVDSGADCVGFVVEYPVPVPWNLSRSEAAELIAQVPPFVTRAVVTGGAPNHVIAVSEMLRPHILQLHTDNSVEETALIARELSKLGIGLVRALRIDVSSNTAAGEIPDPLEAAKQLECTGISAILLDAKTEELPAGTGCRTDWTLARKVRDCLEIPLILAGGLNPNNVAEAISAVKPYGVDVITGVEVKRRMKSPELVRRFVRNAKQADL
ncbi:MAG: phosphoribosylanthranilate isomerase [Armatimonadota bacterium]|nr:phosphoribosylanthranilate isomerase [Armatimonadota bacterium]